MLSVAEQGAWFEVDGRVVRWTLQGQRKDVVDDDGTPEGAHAVRRLPRARTSSATAAPTHQVSFRRLSDPSVVVWTSDSIADEPLYDPLALSPDGRRLVTWGERRPGGAAYVGRPRALHRRPLRRPARPTGPARRGAVGGATGAYLVEVQRSYYSGVHEGLVRCTVGGDCAYAVAPNVDASPAAVVTMLAP